MTLDQILEEIKQANSIVILTHENPDGDAVALPFIKRSKIMEKM